MGYHPNFFEKEDKNAVRKNCFNRLKLILENIDTNKENMLDAGCSGGYYSFGLSDKFTNILAIDNQEDLIENCNKIKVDNNIDNVDFKKMDLTEIILDKQKYDCILYLSTHHHVCQQNGFKKATEILLDLSKKTNMMFFDMGQKDENCFSYAWWKELPELLNVSSQKEWLYNYLTENTVFKNFSIIGTSPIHGTRRFLWKMEK